jgi:hypothetical protein
MTWPTPASCTWGPSRTRRGGRRWRPTWGELRDYFDVLAIERDAHRRVEEGIALALRKYRPRGREQFVTSLLRSLAYLDDVEGDPAVPMARAEVAAYWAGRVPEITANLSRWR